ncbi:UDP-N-acetylglucosamine--N-acetylmuramyl-(pentapeptide) pyrophosphoryl-undecaprenol N-acetylglucosamine transferase [Alkaliphilus metalliredigens QYMF]|uniref:UDP-N-acetylglucosamine--N-acetylmuramyl-(pentapeptide) pyrophosphoryl-undecaprenol N-acetylglucosamine transferase n=1 Tax=Alkaliphilus metalliredigens (strain QYMF) TaxID=293826 RepID=MURG_ALKMQ|nr:undecaprenyldiphospho-muramoylpentapeptide beta-N-acetylglucosaminyltransferase [Alkaliphilus metalliredigens]A6TS61.1 RecName: Full=UDP-N-acetylglucosamine--N-acetylmuramyl-(pentapeptide) pyrophosphoryl-undecaprenol N-acetylglucosamine transferase; AltName: Full=Undecaprenyl-PP-MurNAc-pentapeptide-UDPGlcNAc GlcNAc transferase [Alkaliphilus metalliredigens QYMF]ABR49029.1 UDP-N-acetylglucosamine--N-acetylmuramyl-(pentapeptide) pyrophosphoryl-undecaprenol N-acetylglucosamine transferase [Alkali
MRIMISGGGTGGHIYPAIAIANQITEKHPQAKIQFVGTAKGLESELIPKAGYEIKHITVSYLRRKISFHNVKSIAKLIKGLVEARRLIKDFNPDVVIGTGGFVCGPVLYMATKLGYKTLIHEQNVFPGLTNRVLGNYVDRIALSFEEAERYFKSKEKLIITGNPIRREFLEISQEEATQKYNSGSKKHLILVVGGSGGAARINETVVNLLKKHPNNDFKILLVTGQRHFETIKLQLGKKQDTLRYNDVLPYLTNMPHALKACDLLICSAGAITIAEVTAVGKPAIIIPKSYTAGNHQEFNAKALEEKGAAIMIKEEVLNADRLYLEITGLLSDKKRLEQMAKASALSAKTQALEMIYAEVISMIKS